MSFCLVKVRAQLPGDVTGTRKISERYMTRSTFTNRTCVLCIIAKKTIKSFMEAGAFMYQLNSNEFSSFYTHSNSSCVLWWSFVLFFSLIVWSPLCLKVSLRSWNGKNWLGNFKNQSFAAFVIVKLPFKCHIRCLIASSCTEEIGSLWNLETSSLHCA